MRPKTSVKKVMFGRHIGITLSLFCFILFSLPFNFLVSGYGSGYTLLIVDFYFSK